MPTLLVTRKMSRSLAARVQTSVEGRRRAPGARIAPRAAALLRFAVIAVILFALFELVTTARTAHRELEQERAALLARIQHETTSLSAEQRALVTRVQPWLAELDGAYDGDLVTAEARSPDVFARPTVYVRGQHGALAASAAESYPDAFVLCLVAPPRARTEHELRVKARAAMTARGMDPARNVARYADAVVALPLLAPGFAARVAATDDRTELDALQRTFERAPVEGAKRAARAVQLLLVVDEAGSSTGLSELDGERPHDVRVGLVDLAAKKVVLRLRRHVDPGWASAATRAELAKGIDSCALAMDVRAALASP